MLPHYQASSTQVGQTLAFDGIVSRYAQHRPIVHLTCGNKAQCIKGRWPGHELNIQILGAQVFVDNVSFLHRYPLAPQIFEAAQVVPGARKNLAACC